SLARAQEFAESHGIERAYGSYEQLLEDPEISIVYIAAPHSAHLELALLAINAGKHIVVEKPIATSAVDAHTIRAAANAAGVFAMEALWSRYLPQTSVVDQLLHDGVLGDIGFVGANFGFAASFDPKSRLFDPALAGGALLDLGVYCAWFAHFVLGAPTTVAATGSLAATGVDQQSVVTLGYDGAAQSSLSSSIIADLGQRGMIGGTAARLEFDESFLAPSSFRLFQGELDPLEYPQPDLKWRDGLCYQATAAAQYVTDGLTESPLHNLGDSIAVLEVLDAVRTQLGAL
ncbi:MAG: Gfo/Idh/MocA family oxidoreductase, partial [Rhodoglobus sp.]|nr:Gfo/Idh/MocA family oxidoreductase [Rhodoglobus sp.]